MKTLAAVLFLLFASGSMLARAQTSIRQPALERLSGSLVAARLAYEQSVLLSHCSEAFKHRRFDRESVYRVGMLVESGRAIYRIHDTGGHWRSW